MRAISASSGAKTPFVSSSTMGLSKTPSWTRGEHLEELVERAEPAGQHRREAGAHRQHQPLALLQVGGDDDALGVARRRLEMAQEAGQHASDVGAAFARGMRDLAHQPDIAAAEHHVEAVARKKRAEAPRVPRIGRIAALRGAAEDADGGPDIVHDGIGVAVERPSS